MTAVLRPAQRDDLGERLRSAVGLKERRPQPAPIAERHADFILGGQWEDTVAGPALYLEQVYSEGSLHGDYGLSELLDHVPATLARLGCDSAIDDLIFLDVETTGLNGGTGTLAFLIGVARFEGRALRLRQYFLPQPRFEPAMLAGLSRFAEGATRVVSYNGVTFDLPLLEGRYTITRQLSWARGLAQLDLLVHARRFYRRSLESCRLKEIESAVLGVQRGADIEGWEVPAVYFDFVRSGSPGRMPAVIRHNALDVLSLVTLLRRLAGLLSGEAISLPSEALALARIAETEGSIDSSLRLLEEARVRAVSIGMREFVTQSRLRVLKRARRWSEVRDGCIEELNRGSRNYGLYLEASKACEHHTRELELALRMAEAALLRVSALSYHDHVRRQVEHRRERLLRKLARRAGSGQKEGPPCGGPIGSEIGRLPLPAQLLAERVLAGNRFPKLVERTYD